MTPIYARRFPGCLTRGPTKQELQRRGNEAVGYGAVTDAEREKKLEGHEWQPRSKLAVVVRTLSGDEYPVHGWAACKPGLLALLAKQHRGIGATPATVTLVCGGAVCESGDLDAATRLGLLDGRIDCSAAGVGLLWKGTKGEVAPLLVSREK